MQTRTFRVLIIISTFVVIYLAMPFIAGITKLGDVRGPVLYSTTYHKFVYRIGYSLAGHGKPRIPVLDSFISKRPIFYGFRPRLISDTEFHILNTRMLQDGDINLASKVEEQYLLRKSQVNAN